MDKTIWLGQADRTAEGNGRVAEYNKIEWLIYRLRDTYADVLVAFNFLSSASSLKLLNLAVGAFLISLVKPSLKRIILGVIVAGQEGDA